MTPTDNTQPRQVLVGNVIGNAKWNSFFLTAIGVCVLTSACDGFDSAVFGVATPLLIKALNVTPAQVGVLASWGMAGMLVGAFLFGILGDVLGRKKALMLCSGIFCLFTGLCGFTQGFTQFAIIRFIAGVGLAGLGPNAGALMAEYCPTKLRSSVVPFLSWGIMVGSIMVSLVGIFLVSRYGWRVLFFTSFILLALLFIQAIALPDTMSHLIKTGKSKTIATILHRADPAFIASADDSYQLGKAEAGKMSFGKLFAPEFRANTLLFCGILFCTYFIMWGLTMWLPKLMMQVGSSYTLALWFNIIFFVGALGGIPVSSYLAYRMPIKRLINWLYLVCAISVALLWVKVSIYLTVVLLLVGGGSLQMVMGLLTAYTAQSYPLPVRSRALGVIWVVGRAGSIVSPILLGALVHAGVRIQIDFGVMALPCLVGILLSSFTKDYTRIGLPEQAQGKEMVAAAAKA